MRYSCAVDVASVSAVDVHVHVEIAADGHLSLPRALLDASAKYFRSADRTPSLDDIAARYRAWNIAAVVFTVDAQTQLGHPPISSAEVAAGAARHNDVLIPFGSVDPHRPDAVDQAVRLVEESGVMGFKFHPSVQGFDPSDERYYPLYESIQELGVPALFHTGQNGIGAGLPGGHGIKLAYSNPLLLDAVAADFPRLQVILAHPSVPWQEEANAIATHKSNVWIDLSGWSPKYFPESLVRATNRFFGDRVLFGSDYPLLEPGTWLEAFEQAGFAEHVRPGIRKDNAVRLLGLGGTDEGSNR